MSNVIATDVQTQEVGSQDAGTTAADNTLVELFEVTLPDGTTLYFHPGLDSDLTDVQFRDKTGTTGVTLAVNLIIGNTYTILGGSGTTWTAVGAADNNLGTTFIATGVGTGQGYATQTDNSIRDYTPMPMMIDGLEIQADGASSRPSLTIANIGSLLQGEMGDFKNDDLIGQRIRRRQTLRKYLVGGDDDASPPIEFPTQEYVIDRIGAETNIAIMFEVATPFDLENIQIPRRIVVGKYCSWKYQGYDAGLGGGCTWNLDGAVNFKGDSTVRAHKVYFDFDDRPLVAAETFAAYSASTAYTTVSYVTTNTPTVSAGAFVIGLDYTIASAGNTSFTSIGAANNTVGTVFRATGVGSGTGTATLTKYWLCKIAGTGNTPSVTSSYWKEVRKWAEHANATNYYIGDLVRYNATTVWRCKVPHTSSATITPTNTSAYWVREEICGKTMQSCKARFGFKPSVLTSANQKPEGVTNLAARLPFGSFPGTLKY
jgi:lambda family phage minor tail protein L